MANHITTDAALKAAIAADFPAVAIRKSTEWNEWHIQAKEANGSADWRNDGGRAFVDCGFDKASKEDARIEAYEEARRLALILAGNRFSY